MEQSVSDFLFVQKHQHLTADDEDSYRLTDPNTDVMKTTKVPEEPHNEWNGAPHAESAVIELIESDDAAFTRTRRYVHDVNGR